MSTSTTRIIEVFRPGTFTPMNGQPITFGADDLEAIANVYDGAVSPVPAVIGHPKTDDPAFGWAKSFSYDPASQRLLAEVGEIEPQFAEAVKEGRFKKISLSLFSPDAPNNPKPGSWYPKHIGFLGAAAPAVSGLKPVSFAADGAGVLTFEFADASALRDVAGLFRSMREWIIEKFGSDVADKALPGWTIGWIDDAADRDPPRPFEFSNSQMAQAPSATAGFAAPPSPEKPGALGLLPIRATATEPQMDPTKKAADEAAFAAREQALNERERAANHADNRAFAERLVSERRLLPVLKDKVVGLLDSLSPVGGSQLEVSFAEGGETKKSGALDLVKDVLAKQPAVVAFGATELGQDAPAIDFAMPEGMSAEPGTAELHARAVAYQASHPGTDYMTAVAAVNR